MKSKILISIMTIALVASLAGTGLYAYFSDTETSSGNTFTAGTLNLKLANSGDPYTDGVTATWESPDNWAPGETVEATLYLQNHGTIDIGWIGIKPVNVAGTAGFADKIIVKGFSMADTASAKGIGVGDPDGFADFMATWGIWGSTAPLTLAEFASGDYSFYTEPSDWLLLGNIGTTTTITIEFEFDPEADNTYQGAWCTFDLSIVVLQDGDPNPTFVHVGDACGYAPMQ